MGSKEIQELHDQLEQQKQEVAQSPEVARKLLEELGLWHLTMESSDHMDTPSVQLH